MLLNVNSIIANVFSIILIITIAFLTVVVYTGLVTPNDSLHLLGTHKTRKQDYTIIESIIFVHEQCVK